MEYIQRSKALSQIAENISRNGYHIYLVTAANNPRFAYTIGLRSSLGFELVLAGACFYMADQVEEIIDSMVSHLKQSNLAMLKLLEVSELGSFTLREVHASWTASLLLGALDFYQTNDVLAYQIAPDEDHWTLDVPDMSQVWNSSSEPVWKWLHEPWSFPVPSESIAGTNLGALRGEQITEVMRWEENEWELFAGAGPDVPKEEMRVVPLGTLLAADPSLEPTMLLQVGQGLWRDVNSGWHPWSAKS